MTFPIGIASDLFPDNSAETIANNNLIRCLMIILSILTVKLTAEYVGVERVLAAVFLAFYASRILILTEL
ncbi:hypothetical protein A0J61_06696 [Choanephora cucurbitarum]|uniref:Uncharacterized protein n=1 Tax=Choanephora cucurbitarum TaxID=101091 RepID=A0A1C7N802_9FUNG|nr:hypothetical protein A0J61_06696 [Choanephora cucurbitarum]